jgi:probable HAF family extracellular repeat protein
MKGLICPTVVLCGLVVASFLSSTLGAPPRYRLTRLGTLDNASTSALQSAALGVNNLNQVVGYSDFDASLEDRAFLWLPEAALNLGAGMHNLGVLGSDASSRARDLNDTGYVVGRSRGRSPDEVDTGFLWLDHDPPGPAFHAGLNPLIPFTPSDPSHEAWDITDTTDPVIRIVGSSGGDCREAVLWAILGDFTLPVGTPAFLPHGIVSVDPPIDTELHAALAVNPTVPTITAIFIGGSSAESCTATIVCSTSSLDIRPTSWQNDGSDFLNVPLNMAPLGNDKSEARGARDDGAHVGYATKAPGNPCRCRATFWPNNTDVVDLHSVGGLGETISSGAEAVRNNADEVVGWKLDICLPDEDVHLSSSRALR